MLLTKLLLTTVEGEEIPRAQPLFVVVTSFDCLIGTEFAECVSLSYSHALKNRGFLFDLF